MWSLFNSEKGQDMSQSWEDVVSNWIDDNGIEIYESPTDLAEAIMEDHGHYEFLYDLCADLWAELDSNAA
jgi:hypothetical protein